MNTKSKKVLVWLSVFVVAMFFFAYALVPLYDVMCKALGINGKTIGATTTNTSYIDKSREITVQFLVTNNENLDWTFRSNIKKISLHPGVDTKVTYYARNNTNKTMTVQAIPSVTPSRAARHFKKTECFCFNQQTLKPHQSMNMPVIFHLDNSLPKNIHEVTLSYTLFNVKRKSKRQAIPRQGSRSKLRGG